MYKHVAVPFVIQGLSIQRYANEPYFGVKFKIHALFIFAEFCPLNRSRDDVTVPTCQR